MKYFSRWCWLVVALLGLLAGPARAAEDDTAADDASKTPAWFKDLSTLVLSNSARAKTTAEARLAEARQRGDAVTEAYALLILCHAARRQNDTAAAVRHSREAVDLAERSGDDLLRFNAYYGYALSFRSTGDYATAIDYLLRALVLANAGLSPRALASANGALGSCYETLGDLPRALAYKQRALDLAEKIGDQPAIGTYVHNLASLEETMGNLAAARTGFTRALELAKVRGNRTEIADEQEELAILDLMEGRPAQALAALQPILAQRRTLRGRIKLTHTLGCIAECLLKLDRKSEALAAIEEARGYADAIESHGVRAATYRRLAAVHEARGDFAAALAAARREFAERDAIAGEAAQRRTAELQVQFDVARKNDELTRLARANELQAAAARARAAQLAQTAAELRASEAELARSRNFRLALAAAALAAAAVLGAIIFVQRTRIRSERRILADTRAARDAAQEADALKGRLLGFASHDLKAPLATLSAATHLLEDSATSPAEVKTLAEAMRAETSRMVLLVHDFIDRAALDAGKLELRSSPLDLGRVAATVAADFRPRAEAKRQSLAVEQPPSPLPLVMGEQIRLEQVLANLLSNAIHYTPPRGSIRLVLGHDDTGVWCEVTDTGPGISPADQARLFQPFSRLSAPPTGGEASSGLGLFLAHELVRLHRGTLTIRSELGAGATFRLTLAAQNVPVATT